MSAQTDRFQVLRKLPKIRFDEELRGYSRNQVDRVLHSLAPLADEVDQLQARLNQAETRAASAEAQLATQPEAAAPAPAPVVETAPATPADFDETLRNTLLLAQRTADQTVKDANAEAERLVAEAEATAAELTDAGRREADEIQARNDAERERLEAELAAERTQRLSEIAASSSDRLASIESELEAAHDAQRQQLLTDISELERRRGALNDEIERFEAHLATRREAVRSAIADLERVADGDHGLHGEMPPEPVDIAETDAADFEPVQVSSGALDELREELDSEAAAQTVDTVTDIDADVAVAAAVETDDDQPVDLDALLSEDSGPGDDDSFRAEDLLGDAVPDDAVPIDGDAADDGTVGEVADEEATTDESPTDDGDDAHTSGILLGEVDAGPAPDAVGPATEAVDVLNLDDDGRHSWDVPGTAADDAASTETPSSERPSFEAPSYEAPSYEAKGFEAPENTQPELGLGDDLPQRSSGPADAPSIERPQWADEVPTSAEAPTPPSDPFLDELRRVTEDDDAEDDALARFLESDPEEDSNKGGSWFGRRK